MSHRGRKRKKNVDRHPGGKIVQPTQKQIALGGKTVEDLEAIGMTLETFYEDAGRDTRYRQRRLVSDAIDLVYAEGALGPLVDVQHDTVTKPRKQAAEWLRETHVTLHPGKSVMEPDVVKITGEIADSTAYQFRDYNRALSALGTAQSAVQTLCCDNQVPRDLAAMQQGLDTLARHRGIC